MKKLIFTAMAACMILPAAVQAAKIVATYEVNLAAGERYAADINGSIIRYNSDLINEVTYYYQTVNNTFPTSTFKYTDMPLWCKTFDILALSRNHVLVKYSDNVDAEEVSQTAYAVFLIKSDGTNVACRNMSGDKYTSPLPGEVFIGMDSGRLISCQYDNSGDLAVIRNYNVRFVASTTKIINGSDNGKLNPLNPKISAYYVNEVSSSSPATITILKY